MDIDLKGRRAVVCGSTQGIGKAIALELALLGADVTLFARNEASLKSVFRELSRAEGQNHHYLVADFSNPGDVSSQMERHLADGYQPTILINNSGGPPGGPLIEASFEDIIKPMKVHLACSHLLVQTLLPFMKAQSYGRVVNIISTSVKIPIPGLGVSNTVRGSMANWSKTLSVELAPFGVTVNNVLPGFTWTSRLESIIEDRAQKGNVTVEDVSEAMRKSVPAQRFGRPEEVGAMAAFLCTPAAAYINGTNIPVDGGRTGSL